MAKPASSRKHLKLYTEQPPKKVRSPIESVASLPDLLKAFQAATGWSLEYANGSEGKQASDASWSAPVVIGPANVSGFLRLEQKQRDEDGNTSKSLPAGSESAQQLAGSVAEVLGELMQTRYALWQREAELAAGVPVLPQRENEKHLAERLEALLRSAAECVGGSAAGLYLLDEATTELKLRCSHGLPFDRLTAPARPLQGALADLEAMLGHAVVLNDEHLVRVWNMPENFPAAVCIPVSSPTTLLGTLWVFSNEQRDFNDRETNLLEIIAGRIASELEREMLLRIGATGTDLQKQLAAAERVQRNELPTISPLLDGWNVAGWTSQAAGVGSAFHDWFCLPRGLLAVSAASAPQKGITGALTANVVKTAVRSHARYHRQAERVLQQVNLTLWTGSAGDQHSDLLCGLIETATGRVSCSSAGQVSLLRVHEGGWESLSQTTPLLGESPEAGYEQFGYEISAGEVYLIASRTICEALNAQGRPFGELGIAEALHGKLHLTAEEMVAVVREAYEHHTNSPQTADTSLLIIKRTA